VFPVRCELDFYIFLRRNSVGKGLITNNIVINSFLQCCRNYTPENDSLRGRNKYGEINTKRNK
jgi:hypothetical protein